MKKILLACSGGFSTSMLVTRMKDAMKKRGLEYEILAVSEDDINNHLDSDILLLAPQLGHILEEKIAELDFPVVCIDSYEYGTMNGENVLNSALNVIQGEKQ